MLTVAKLEPGRWRVHLHGTARYSWLSILTLVVLPAGLALLIVALSAADTVRWPALIPSMIIFFGLGGVAVYDTVAMRIRPASLTHGSEQRDAAERAVQLYQSLSEDELRQAGRWLAIATIRTAWQVECIHRRIMELDEPPAINGSPLAHAIRTALRRRSSLHSDTDARALQHNLWLDRQRMARLLELLQDLDDHDCLLDIDYTDVPL